MSINRWSTLDFIVQNYESKIRSVARSVQFRYKEKNNQMRSKLEQSQLMNSSLKKEREKLYDGQQDLMGLVWYWQQFAFILAKHVDVAVIRSTFAAIGNICHRDSEEAPWGVPYDLETLSLFFPARILESDPLLPHKTVHVLSDGDEWENFGCNHRTRVSLEVNFVNENQLAPFLMNSLENPTILSLQSASKALLRTPKRDIKSTTSAPSSSGTTRETFVKEEVQHKAWKAMVCHIRELALPLPSRPTKEDPKTVYFDIWRSYNAQMIPYKNRWNLPALSPTIQGTWLRKKIEELDRNTNAVAFEYGYGFGPHQTPRFVDFVFEIPDIFGDMPSDDEELFLDVDTSDDEKDFHVVT